MRPVQRLLRFGAVAAGLSLAGCAPGFGMGPGVQLGLEPTTGQLSLAPSSCMLTGSAYGTQGLSRMGNSAFAFAPRIARLQSRFSLGHADRAVQMESWKQVATGSC
ncbi:MAG: hypothetical protein AB1941_10905 [Gemmatimonadota bacterium]